MTGLGRPPHPPALRLLLQPRPLARPDHEVENIRLPAHAAVPSENPQRRRAVGGNFRGFPFVLLLLLGVREKQGRRVLQEVRRPGDRRLR